jgi:hypothetical protein
MTPDVDVAAVPFDEQAASPIPAIMRTTAATKPGRTLNLLTALLRVL